MNERIKLLALQAGLKQRIWNSLGKELPMWQEDPDNPGLEKFTELIVQECAQVAADFVPGYGLVPFSKRFKEHYGVEEK